MAENSTRTRNFLNKVLKTCKAIDSASSIRSVSRVESSDGMLLRLKTGGGSASLDLRRALCTLWPLAAVSSVENVVEGGVDLHLLMPSPREQEHLARDIVKQSTKLRSLMHTVRVFGLAGLVAFAVAVTAGLTR